MYLRIFFACSAKERKMKKVVAAAGMAVVSEVSASAKSEFSLIDENLLKSRIYTIRGVKVMLDADLAEIYGYSTKAFNRQVKNNIERFAGDFRFQLSNKEIEELSRCKLGMRTNSWTQLEDASCILPKIKSPRLWKHFMI